MKIIKFIHNYDIYGERTVTQYFSLKELKSFSYDSAQCYWKFEFPNERMEGHARINLKEFDLFLESSSIVMITFEDCPLGEENISHLQEVKRLTITD